MKKIATNVVGMGKLFFIPKNTKETIRSGPLMFSSFAALKVYDKDKQYAGLLVFHQGNNNPGELADDIKAKLTSMSIPIDKDHIHLQSVLTANNTSYDKQSEEDLGKCTTNDIAYNM